MMLTGERQVAATYEGIRADHMGRYEWATIYVSGDVLDVACGVGYGSHYLARYGCNVIGVDRSHEAIDYANEHWLHQNNKFICADIADFTFPDVDWTVCFETLEHVEDDSGLLNKISLHSRRLLISVPNQEVIPLVEGRFKYHVRHYTPDQFTGILDACGWKLNGMFSQAGPTTRTPVPGDTGRTIIAMCERT